MKETRIVEQEIKNESIRKPRDDIIAIEYENKMENRFNILFIYY